MDNTITPGMAPDAGMNGPDAAAAPAGIDIEKLKVDAQQLMQMAQTVLEDIGQGAGVEGSPGSPEEEAGETSDQEAAEDQGGAGAPPPEPNAGPQPGQPGTAQALANFMKKPKPQM